MHPIYDVLLECVRNDVGQMAEEGHDLAALRAELETVAARQSLDDLARFQEDLWRRPSPPEFPYEEPSDWKTVSGFFPDPDSHTPFAGSDEDLADRLLGAWQGRCAGCQLGKPLEGTMWPDKIRQVLETVGSWPLDFYMNPAPGGMAPEQLPDCDFFQRDGEWRNTLCRGNFDHVAPDDDVHYALVSQGVIEEFSPDFTGEDVVAKIVERMPYSTVWAAGKSMFRTAVMGLKQPHTAIMGNPCRQSLGAQIRCDPFGWAAPGNPALAAKMAFTDAATSQTRNGIYSGVFFATLMADTLAQGDPVRAIDTAAQYVPPRSRFAEMVAFIRDACSAAKDWQAANAALLAKYEAEAPRFNHALPNAAIVLMGLLMGGGDFARTLGITVMAGLDTDCTGATVGSIMGCARGAKGIPNEWIEPFQDTIRTEVKGMPEVRITEVAHRLHVLAKRYGRFAG